jgi:hypothetical protein
LTDLPGTGAPTSGLTLADGSLLITARIPWSRRLANPINHDLYGLQFARSFDAGKTWRTEYVLQHDPRDRPFDDYYNTMNGGFVPVGPREWLYVFGQFDVKHSVHRILSLHVKVDRDK